MKCPTCKNRMKCLDTRWQAADKVTLRRWQCACGVRGKTVEQWLNETVAEKPKQPEPSKPSKPLTPRKVVKQKIQKQVVDRRRPSQFDDIDEDYSPSRNEDFRDIGLDLPYGKDW